MKNAVKFGIEQITFLYRVIFLFFSIKKKTSSQPIRPAVSVNPVTKKGRDWLLGGFSPCIYRAKRGQLILKHFVFHPILCRWAYRAYLMMALIYCVLVQLVVYHQIF